MTVLAAGADPVEIRWQVRRFDPGEQPGPGSWPQDGWVAAVVPGSLAASAAVVEAYGVPALAEADHSTWWLRGNVILDQPLPRARLVLDRIATHADVYLDGQRILRSDNAFRRHVIDLGALTAGPHEIAVRIASFGETPVPRKPRPRWRSSLLPDPSLRWRRTPLLGRIPTWEGVLPPVGILGEAGLRARPRAEVVSIRTQVEPAPDGWTARLALHVRAAEPLPVEVTLDGERLTAEPTLEDDGAWHLRLSHDVGVVSGDDGATLWWPHTHGLPRLRRLHVRVGGETVLDRRIGFSHIRARREDDRFAIAVNGVDVFVRGVVWATTDPLGWTSDPAEVARDLDALVAAGINLVRIPGTGTYADQVLRELAAERGLLVWQDAMLATFDPPEDEAWLAELEAELRDQLGAWGGWPHLAVVCGGTETEQQPTLMGLPPERRRMTALHDLLPRLADELVPGAIHVTSSPSGGPRPVSIEHGVSHYFGVGAYLRPLEDARTARVSFASEALTFAIPPEPSTMAELDDLGLLPAPDDRGRGSAWRRAAPHDRGTSWDFVDVTDHYVRAWIGRYPAGADNGDTGVDTDVDAAARQLTTEGWEDLQRRTVARVMTESFAWWRSSPTPTGGAIVLAHRDLAPGPGWGLIDVIGAPKAPLLALPEVLAPVALLLLDRGLDGVLLEAVNDTGRPVRGTLRLEALDLEGDAVLDAELELAVPARGHAQVEVEEALGGFRDLGWAWRFASAPAYSAVRARWVTDGAGEVRATRPLLPPTIPTPTIPTPVVAPTTTD
ncbi:MULTISPECIES: glycosyl hydrolase 2 galactose-binding domain-containing protein [Arsenicicoccus]|uniref:glycosyl hydrolase 2 galactose-binding domain-containing protein n=1 Tax=Arsenicicoccus TaxID=267408 RepID=UPI0003FB7660|nr:MULTISPECIES: hypothetical protein [Arsenicicoccus]